MTIWRGTQPLILASKSPARQALLRSAGLSFEVIPADLDERAIELASGRAGPGKVAGLLAREKALAVSLQHRNRFVVGADQTLALGEQRFSKPATRAEAVRQLQALAGRTHELHSAVAIAREGKQLWSDIAIARMTMRPLDDVAISGYLDAAGEAVTTSVGAYQLEGLGVHLFEQIDGDHFTILGLPLLPLLEFLRSRKLLAV
ncbi:MAG: nucleoside triphosphate pyrophosphatase [Bradyrhizobium sp.]|jgi:septum formation protein|nr:nucleoside triphosphate pyrophosphatase [Bradyrhizobium sp.]